MTPTIEPEGRLPGSPSSRSEKRGVLLLVVLSLLTLFMLLGTTYMVVTSRARATARAFARASEASHSAQSAAGRRFVDEAFLAVARGPSNPPSTWTFARGEDLLGDKYGYASGTSTGNRLLLTGSLAAASAIEPNVPANLVFVPIAAWAPTSAGSIERNAETLGGRVLTFTLPDFTWSTRILRARGTNGGAATGFVISLAPVAGSRGTTLAELNAAITRAPTSAGAPAHFVINTREFAGQVGTPPAGTTADTNEPYDGFGSANPFLAQVVQSQAFSPSATGTIATGSCARASYQSAPPSSANPPPVDNDGDGTPDSYWLDFGFPVVRDSAGVVCKPRAAVLVLDLDGRVNVNAHGSPAELAFLQNSSAFQWPSASPELPAALPAATFATLPLGSGYGPAEVRLGDVLLIASDTAGAGDALRLLLTGT
ncbi:MAG: hypothetical protein ACKO40_12905, partial [Planctomycetaceae bacterium]